jgi:single-strand DNA-binding protein
MMNRVVLVGRLTKDPTLRYTPNGVAVANFTIAANRPFKDANGERHADFINCVSWKRQAENLANFMKKGNLIGVDGRLQSRTYDDKDGKTVFVTEIVTDNVQFLESKSANQTESSNQGFNQNQPPRGNQSNAGYPQNQYEYAGASRGNNMGNEFGEPLDISQDDLPF